MTGIRQGLFKNRSMSPEQSKNYGERASRRLSEEAVVLPRRAEHRTDLLTLHSPRALVLHSVCADVINNVLKGLIPVLSNGVGEYLHELVKDNKTLTGAKLSEIYFYPQPFVIRQTQAYTLGAGDARHVSHTVEILPYTLDDVGLVELQSSGSDSKEVELRIQLTSLPVDLAWNWVNSVGASIGCDNISQLFAQAHPEQVEDDDNGLRVTKLNQLVSVETQHNSEVHTSSNLSEIVPDIATQHAAWVPQAVSCRLDLYTEEQEILKIVASETLGNAVFRSGLLRYCETFSTHTPSEVRVDRLQKISSALPIPLGIKFYKRVDIGLFEESGGYCEPLSNMDSDNDYAGREEFGGASEQQIEELEARSIDASYLGAHPDSSEELPADSEVGDLQEYSDFDRPVSGQEDYRHRREVSTVIISGLPSDKGTLLLSYGSDAERAGTEVLTLKEECTQNRMVLSVEFQGGAPIPSASDLKHRWGMVLQIGAIVNSPVNSKEITLYLDIAPLPQTQRPLVDVVTNRLTVLVTHKVCSE